MKVLVTGAGGFLGKRIVESLLNLGVQDVRVHVRQSPPAGFIEGLQKKYPQAHLEVAQANLLSKETLPPLVSGVDCVIHAAAGMKGATADMFANTVMATRNLLDAIGEAGVKRVVQISSFAVFKASALKPGQVLDESTPIEETGVDRGPYGYAKTRQEQMFMEYQRKFGFESIVLRPGVIYGPGGGEFSPRVGIKAMGMFASLGGPAILPLTYVENCADAVATAALRGPAGSTYCVVDDDLPTCAQYLQRYQREVRKMRVIRIPFGVFRWLAKQLENYHRKSKGQLPAIFTPLVVDSVYRPLRYSNAALKSIGWTPRVSTNEGIARAFEYFRSKKA